MKARATPTLFELQNWMRWIVTEPQGVRAALEEGRSEPQPSCRSFINGDERFAQEGRLSIYAEAYFARILESLRDDFPALERRLGSDAFARLIVDYLRAYPSRHDGLQSVGSALPTFLRQMGASGPSELAELAGLAELAELEWKVMESFYADLSSSPESSTPGGCSLSEVNAEELAERPLVLDPSLRLMRASWDIESYRSRGGEKNRSEDSTTENPFFFEIRRPGGRVEVSLLVEGEFTALCLATEGKCLAEICEALSSSSPDDIRSWTSRWVENRILLGVRARK